MRPQQNRFKLALLISHPIHYQVALFQKLAQHPNIDLTVYFCSDEGVTAKYRKDLGISYKWDVPLLEGYRYEFLKNWSPVPSANRFWGLFNPGIIRKLWNERYDAILVHGYNYLTHWLVFVAAWLKGSPVLLRGETVLRNEKSLFRVLRKKLLFKALFPRIGAFLPIGTKSRELYQHYGIPGEKLFLTPYAVDNDRFYAEAERWKRKKAEIKRETGIPERIPVILYAAKMISRKRPLDCLRAFQPVADKAALLFVGDGELRSSLEAYTRENKLRNVFFAGFKNQSEIARYYAASDIFVLPSSYEPWGLVVNEAMCFGLPIITTEGVAAAADLVRHRENGFVYQPGNVEALGKCLTELIADPGRREKMGLRSREIIEGWNYDVCVEGVLKALESLKQKTGGANGQLSCN